MPYLGPGVKNQKNKGTFFSPTLFFSLLTPGPRYGHSDSKSIFSKVIFMSVEQKIQLLFLKKIAIFYFFYGELNNMPNKNY